MAAGRAVEESRHSREAPRLDRSYRCRGPTWQTLLSRIVTSTGNAFASVVETATAVSKATASMISYDPDNHPDNHYLLSYQSLREDYRRYRLLSDEEFTAELLNII